MITLKKNIICYISFFEGKSLIGDYVYNPGHTICSNIIQGNLQVECPSKYILYAKSVIPAGSEVWISEDLRFIQAKQAYITDEVLKEGCFRANLKEFYESGADVYLLGNMRYNVLSGGYLKNNVIGVCVGDLVISTRFIRVFKDKPQLSLVEDYCYDKGVTLPSREDLILISKNLFKINLTLRLLGIPEFNLDTWFYGDGEVLISPKKNNIYLKYTPCVLPSLIR